MDSWQPMQKQKAVTQRKVTPEIFMVVSRVIAEQLRHQLPNHMGVIHIRQPFVSAVEVVRDPLVVQSQ